MDYIEITGALVGLVYLYFEYKASIYLWVASIVMPLIYIYVFYKAGLYADMGINIYYLLAGFYGFMLWLLKKESSVERSITTLPKQLIAPLAAIACIIFAVMAWILVQFTDSTVPYSDAAITALSVIGMWMLAKKYLEQWLVWILVDIACCFLFIYKELYPTTALYALYTVIAIFGYRKWKSMLQHTPQTDSI